MVVEQGRPRYRAGEALPLSMAPEDIHLFDDATRLTKSEGLTTSSGMEPSVSDTSDRR